MERAHYSVLSFPQNVKMPHLFQHFKFQHVPAVSRLPYRIITQRTYTTTISRRGVSVAMSDDPIEEELLPYYSAKHFYPVQPGAIYNERYQTIAKLGFGGGSTVWLARDLNSCVPTGLRSIQLLKSFIVAGGHSLSPSLLNLDLIQFSSFVQVTMWIRKLPNTNKKSINASLARIHHMTACRMFRLWLTASKS